MTKNSYRLLLVKWLGGLLLVAGLSYLLISVLRPVWQQPVTRVIVEGKLHYANRQRIQQVILPQLRKGYFFVNLHNVKIALQTLPWVQQAQVRRLWPDQLIIHLQEQQVVARWGKKGLLNAQHQVFYPASDSDLSHFDQLPHLFGSAGSEDDMMTALELVDHQLRPIDLKVKELVLAKRRAWHLLLTNGIEVKVGRELNVTKLKRFVRFYQGYLAKSRRSAAVIDLRYPHGLAIAWQTNHSKT